MNIKKNNNAYKTISEVSSEIEVPMHILRFWETKFEKLKKVKRQNSHRYYNLEDIAFLKTIKNLIYTEGFTIKGAQKYLNNNKKETKKDNYNRKIIDVLSEIRDEIKVLIKNN